MHWTWNQKKRGPKDGSKVFGLRNRKDGSVLYWNWAGSGRGRLKGSSALGLLGSRSLLDIHMDLSSRKLIYEFAVLERDLSDYYKFGNQKHMYMYIYPEVNRDKNWIIRDYAWTRKDKKWTVKLEKNQENMLFQKPKDRSFPREHGWLVKLLSSDLIKKKLVSLIKGVLNGVVVEGERLITLYWAPKMGTNWILQV